MSAAVTWLQRSVGVDVTGEWARHLHLNVGGVFYTTRRHTFRGLADHPVFGPVLSGRAHRCEDGSFLIDRDGALFRYILAYLRGGTLAVPEPFHEWEMLLQEVRFYQLPELEQLVLQNFDYQRCLFRRQLPHGVYVWWPAAPSSASEELQPSPQHTTAPQSTSISTQRSPDVTKCEGGTAGAPAPLSSLSTCDSRAPHATPPSTLPPRVEGSPTIRIVPPLPGLEVTRSAGGEVMFRGAQVLRDLDQLMTVLLTAYGYTVQHWDEARGRVLLTLPGVL